MASKKGSSFSSDLLLGLVLLCFISCGCRVEPPGAIPVSFWHGIGTSRSRPHRHRRSPCCHGVGATRGFGTYSVQTGIDSTSRQQLEPAHPALVRKGETEIKRLQACKHTRHGGLHPASLLPVSASLQRSVSTPSLLAVAKCHCSVTSSWCMLLDWCN